MDNVGTNNQVFAGYSKAHMLILNISGIMYDL